MKIGIIIGSLGLGGAERVSTRLAEWWVTQNVDVSFYTTMAIPKKEYIISSKIKRFSCYKESKTNTIQELRKTIKEDKPDVVVIMDTPMCVFGVSALLGTGIPFVVSERSDPKNANVRKITKVISRFLMKFADGFVFQTTGARDYYPKTIAKRSVVIANPLVVSEIPDPFEGERKKTVVAIGRLITAKNYPLLFKAFENFYYSHPDYTLEIYGDGIEMENLIKMIDTMSVKDKIHLNGARNDVLECAVDSGMFVLSSDLEGMPNALIEALAIGLPSISTNCPPGGPADLIEDGVNGLLVNVGDVEGLCSAMRRIATDDDFALSLSKNGVKIREKLNIDNIGKTWLEFLMKQVKGVQNERKEDNKIFS